MKIGIGIGLEFPNGSGPPIPPNTLIAGRGVFFLTGDAMVQAYSFGADQGSFALTGIAAALLGANTIGAQSGTFALTGEAAGLGIAMPAAPGAFTLTGEAASFVGGGGTNVTLDATHVLVTGSGTSISWTHTPVGTPSKVAIAFYVDDAAGTGTATATYGGTSMPESVRAGDNVLFGGYAYIFGLANPSSGPQTVTVTFSSSVTHILATSISVTGGDTTTCFDHTASSGPPVGGNATDTTVTVTSATGDLVFDFGVFEALAGTITATGPQTAFITDSTDFRVGAGTTAGAASITPTYHNTVAEPWLALAASLKK